MLGRRWSRNSGHVEEGYFASIVRTYSTGTSLILASHSKLRLGLLISRHEMPPVAAVVLAAVALILFPSVPNRRFQG